MKTLRYLLQLFEGRGFHADPIGTFARALHLSGLIALRRGAVITVPFGDTRFRFAYTHGRRSGGGRGLFLYRQHIEDLMAHGHQFIASGDTVIDGGANQGVFTSAFATRVGATGRVIAFEPMPYAADRVAHNIALNGAQGWVTVVNKALSDGPGTVTLDLSRGVGAASITNDYGGAETRDVQTTTIDTVVAEQGLTQVNFIKLDIEGAELKALHGAQDTLTTHRPIVCLEISTGSGSDIEVQAHHHLLALGYSAHHFVDGALVPLQVLNPPHENVFYLP